MLSSDSSTGKEVFSLDRGLGTPFPLSHVPWVGQVYKQNTVPNPSIEGAETHELDQTPPPWRLDDDVTRRQKVYLGGSAEWEHDFAFAVCFLHRAGLSRPGEGERWGGGSRMGLMGMKEPKRYIVLLISWVRGPPCWPGINEHHA